MAVTWRRELYFDCDSCSTNLCLDQVDAYTKRGMFAIAKREGWVVKGDMCWCPKCAEKQRSAGQQRPTTVCQNAADTKVGDE